MWHARPDAHHKREAAPNWDSKLDTQLARYTLIYQSGPLDYDQAARLDEACNEKFIPLTRLS